MVQSGSGSGPDLLLSESGQADKNGQSMDYSRIQKQVKMQVSLLIGTGLPVGIVAGLAGSFAASDVADTGRILVWGYLALGVFLSIALAVSVWLSLDNEMVLDEGFKPREVYRTFKEGAVTGVISGILGTIGGMAAYFFPGQGFPILIKGYGGNSVMEETLQQLGLGKFLLVLMIVAVVGVLSAAWAYNQIKDSYY